MCTGVGHGGTWAEVTGLETLSSVVFFHLGMSGTSHITVCSQKIETCVIWFEKGPSRIRGYLYTQPILNNFLSLVL